MTWLTDEGLGAELGVGSPRNSPQSPVEPDNSSMFRSCRTSAIRRSTMNRPTRRIELPDAGYQLLALYRFWNIVEYWFPYRDLIDGSWDGELTAFIPRIALANDGDAYKREMMALIARVHDTHANLWSSLAVRPPVGACQIPVTLRFIEDQAVVTGYVARGRRRRRRVCVRGDVVTATRRRRGPGSGRAMDAVLRRVESADAPARYRAVDDARRLRRRRRCRSSTRRQDAGTEDRARDGVAGRVSTAGRTHDRPGDTFRKLSPDVAYLKLSSVQAAQAATVHRLGRRHQGA